MQNFVVSDADMNVIEGKAPTVQIKYLYNWVTWLEMRDECLKKHQHRKGKAVLNLIKLNRRLS